MKNNINGSSRNSYAFYAKVLASSLPFILQWGNIHIDAHIGCMWVIFSTKCSFEYLVQVIFFGSNRILLFFINEKCSITSGRSWSHLRLMVLISIKFFHFTFNSYWFASLLIDLYFIEVNFYQFPAISNSYQLTLVQIKTTKNLFAGNLRYTVI